jgi:hypothetical protein
MHPTLGQRAPAATLVGLLVGTALVLRSPTAAAGGGASSDAYDGVDPHALLDVHGLVDTYVQTDLDAPSARTTPLRAFDDHADLPSLGFAGLTVAHAPATFGFRVDAGIGNLSDAFFDYDPARFGHPAFSRGLSYIEQAFVSVVALLPRPVRFDIGKFGTPVGLEDNESLANWNFSRGLLFTLAEPTYHTGARATVEPTQGLQLTAFWLNGWNTNLFAGNGMRSFGVAATVMPTPGFDIAAEYVGGLERAPMQLEASTQTFRSEMDVSATYKVTPRVSAAVSVDYGRDAASGGVSWWGAGGYVRARALTWLAGVVRAEEYVDPDGFMTGTTQAIEELTTTLEATYRPGPFTLVFRLEYRRDQSSQRVYAGGLTHDDTLGLGVVAGF